MTVGAIASQGLGLAPQYYGIDACSLWRRAGLNYFKRLMSTRSGDFDIQRRHDAWQ